MIKELKVYVAGRVDPDSSFGRHDWRDDFCKELSDKSGCEIINLDPTKREEKYFVTDKDSSAAIFGRDCFMIRMSDFVIVNLTDDISVGSSQEMLIAKYYKRPLIGIAPKGGKFNKSEKDIRGYIYKNYIHPFVAITCDAVVEDVDGAAGYIIQFFTGSNQRQIKDISVIDKALQYYERAHYNKDEYLHFT